MRFLGMAAAAAMLLGACAGRAPQPVQTVQPQDRFMDCAAIMAEVEANNRQVQQLADERGMKTAQNVAAGVAGFVVPVLWFGMDWQGTQDKETAALQSRQQYLAVLAEQKRCGVEPTPPPPPPAASRPAKRPPRPAPVSTTAPPASPLPAT